MSNYSQIAIFSINLDFCLYRTIRAPINRQNPKVCTINNSSKSIAFSAIVVFSRPQVEAQEIHRKSISNTQIESIFGKNEKKSIQKDRPFPLFFDFEGGTLDLGKKPVFSEANEIATKTGPKRRKSTRIRAYARCIFIGVTMARHRQIRFLKHIAAEKAIKAEEKRRGL